MVRKSKTKLDSPAAGRTAAKARGARFGRKPKLNDHQRKEAIKRLAGGESARAVARTYDVHHATVSRLRVGVHS